MSFKYLFFFFVLALTACQSTSKECEHGNPTAMFSKNTAGVSRHEFELNGQNSFEKLRLDSIFEIGDTIKMYIPIELEIIQAGCKDLVQEFRLEYFDDINPIPEELSAYQIAGILVMTFGKIGSTDPKAIAFVNLAEAIRQKINYFKEFKKPVALQDGFTIEIDKMHNNGSTLLTVILKQNKK